MLIWLVAEDGTYIDEMTMDKVPAVGEQVPGDRSWHVVEAPPPDENAARLGAQVIVVKPAGE